MAPDDDRRRHGDDELSLILFRVSAVEQGLKDSRQEFRESFRSVEAHIAALAFVPLSLYLSERDNLKKDIADIGSDVADARKLALSALGTITSAVIGAIVFAIVASIK